MAHIKLYAAPEMDATYANVPWFSSLSTQRNWFHAKAVLEMDARISVDPTRISVTVEQSYAEIEQRNIDYCSLTDQSGKEIYYFITDYEYKTSAATTLVLTIDVMQTYMFDVDYMDSFIERCHVDRFEYRDGFLLPTKNLLDEGLQFGDYIYNPDGSREGRQQFRDKFLISSTTPLGKNIWKRPSGGMGGGGATPSGDCWKNAEVSADLFRLAKGFEGFGPNMYVDSGGVPTIGYGTTQDDIVAWKKLTAVQPCKEEEAAQLAYESFNKNYAKPIKNFVVENFKVDNQHKFDALVDLCYNAGSGRVTKGDLCNILKQYPNDESKVRPVWETWIIRDNNGEIQAGLIDRRKAECDMYFHGKYEKRDISIVDSKGYPTGQIVKDGGWLPSGCSGEAGGEIPNIGDMKAYVAYGDKYIYPLQGGRSKIASKFGKRKHPITGELGKMHYGDDIGSPFDEPIYAAADGTVSVSQNDGTGYGLWIQVDHSQYGTCTRYAHCNKLLVKVGDKVKAGQKIALVGSTGDSTGSHLHYELRNKPYQKADAVDPMPHLKVGAIL